MQTVRPNQYVSVHATSALYSAGPASGTDTKIKSMEAWAGGQDSTELIKWSPTEQRNQGTRDTISIGASVSFKAANFSIGKSWERHEGVVGATNDAGSHVMTWKHANKKGTAQGRSVTGVQVYQTPSGKTGNVGIGGTVAWNG